MKEELFYFFGTRMSGHKKLRIMAIFLLSPDERLSAIEMALL